MKPATRIKSIVMGALASRRFAAAARVIGRIKRTGKPTVHYFHQVDDPSSHLAVQKLNELALRYQVTFEPHLVSAPSAEEQGDPQRFTEWLVSDARSIAPYYGTTLPNGVDSPDVEQVHMAQHILTLHLNRDDFAAVAETLGDSLWRGEPISHDFPAASSDECTTPLAAGNTLRSKLGHWLSGTFYFEGEWYWGLDRLVHLENRLCDAGFSNASESICVPRPVPASLGQTADSSDSASVTLEYFPSLRSPYTAISYDRTIDLVHRTGVNLVLRPVMPMMMRGVPAPRNKQLYIIKDTRREADYYSQAFGRIVDPIGPPVIRAFSLLPFMISKGLQTEYCAHYLRAAWAEGIDITQDSGLKIVVARCGADWSEASAHLDNHDWKPLLDKNVGDMLDAGLWGVPSFRVSGGNRSEPFVCWGQDRLWRVESEIIDRIN